VLCPGFGKRNGWITAEIQKVPFPMDSIEEEPSRLLKFK
jgi:hypothetical protein